MDDNSFDLLTQMYSDFSTQFSDVKGDIKEIKKDMNEVKKDMKILKSDVLKIEIKIENDIERKLDILFETRDVTNNHLDDMSRKLDIISSMVEKHDFEISIIKARQ